MDQAFADQVVVVTGGARGIGDAIIRAFLEQGAQRGLDRPGRGRGPRERTRYLQADVTDLAAVEAAFADIDAHEGRVDVLVNNAGIQRVSLTDRFDPQVWRLVIDVHLFGMFHCSRTALARMLPKRAGAIVSISSTTAFVAVPGRGPYTAAKGGIVRHHPHDGRGIRPDGHPHQRGGTRIGAHQARPAGHRRWVHRLPNLMSEIPMRRPGKTRGDRVRGAFPGQPGCVLHHGPDHRGRRRLDDPGDARPTGLAGADRRGVRRPGSGRQRLSRRKVLRPAFMTRRSNALKATDASATSTSAGSCRGDVTALPGHAAAARREHVLDPLRAGTEGHRDVQVAVRATDGDRQGVGTAARPTHVVDDRPEREVSTTGERPREWSR